MNRWKLAVLLLFCLYGAFLTAESIRARQDRKKLKHIIHVNGTRGKSTVTRLIDAGLRAGGVSVASKSTGTLPVFFHADKSFGIIKRRGPANIREQLKILHLAAREGAEVLIIECMALQRELQWTCQHRMLKADIGVITNSRIDHTDVMGATREAILDTMMTMLPRKGFIFTAEKDLFPQIQEKANALGSQAFLADGWERSTQIDFPENVALALAVCMHLGVSRETALRGMETFVHDPFDMALWRGKNLLLVNALSTNDVTSAKIVYEKASPKKGEHLAILINNRMDRPARAMEMIRLCQEMEPETILLLGDQKRALSRLLRRRVPKADVTICSSADDVPFFWERPTFILAVGNIKNEGIRLYERAERELTRQPRGGAYNVS